MRIFIPERVGSRVIIQILKIIMGENINWTNNDGSGIFDFVFIRDFRDIIVSFWRAQLSQANKHNEYLQRQMTKDEILNTFNSISQQLKMLNLIDPNSTTIIKYEDWYNDFSVIFQHFPDLTDAKKALIKKEWNINAVKQRNIELTTWKDYDSSTGMHGHHISPENGRPGMWKEKIPKKLYPLINELLQPYLKKWNYKE